MREVLHRLPGPPRSEEGTLATSSRTFNLQPRLELGLGYFTCAIFARQVPGVRHHHLPLMHAVHRQVSSELFEPETIVAMNTVKIFNLNVVKYLPEICNPRPPPGRVTPSTLNVEPFGNLNLLKPRMLRH